MMHVKPRVQTLRIIPLQIVHKNIAFTVKGRKCQAVQRSYDRLKNDSCDAEGMCVSCFRRALLQFHCDGHGCQCMNACSISSTLTTSLLDVLQYCIISASALPAVFYNKFSYKRCSSQTGTFHCAE